MVVRRAIAGAGRPLRPPAQPRFALSAFSMSYSPSGGGGSGRRGTAGRRGLGEREKVVKSPSAGRWWCGQMARCARPKKAPARARNLPRHRQRGRKRVARGAGARTRPNTRFRRGFFRWAFCAVRRPPRPQTYRSATAGGACRRHRRPCRRRRWCPWGREGFYGQFFGSAMSSPILAFAAPRPARPPQKTHLAPLPDRPLAPLPDMVVFGGVEETVRGRKAEK